MATHTIIIKASSYPPFDLSGDEFKIVKKTHKVRWKCTNAPVAVVFNISPFDTGEKIVIAAANTPTPYLKIRPPTANQIEVLKYDLIVYYGGELVVDDPVIIIDNDGGGGGGSMKKAARKKSAKKKQRSAKK